MKTEYLNGRVMSMLALLSVMSLAGCMGPVEEVAPPPPGTPSRAFFEDRAQYCVTRLAELNQMTHEIGAIASESRAMLEMGIVSAEQAIAFHDRINTESYDAHVLNGDIAPFLAQEYNEALAGMAALDRKDWDEAIRIRNLFTILRDQLLLFRYTERDNAVSGLRTLRDEIHEAMAS